MSSVVTHRREETRRWKGGVTEWRPADRFTGAANDLLQHSNG
jgi:hypothetical protein